MSQVPNSLYRPIIVGGPETSRPSSTIKTQSSQGTSFQELLQKSLKEREKIELTFSKHAQTRSVQRGITLDESQLDRLGQAVNIAEEKGLKHTLVMMDNNAFIVNVPSKVIVTVVDGSESESTVFTNIDGAVLV